MKKLKYVYTKAEFDRILAAYQQVLALVLKNGRPNSYQGICGNVAEILRPHAYTAFDHMWHASFGINSLVSRDWPGWIEGVSRPDYPIGPHDCGNWEGEARTRRISYLRYLIKRTRDFKRRAKE